MRIFAPGHFSLNASFLLVYPLSARTGKYHRESVDNTWDPAEKSEDDVDGKVFAYPALDEKDSGRWEEYREEDQNK